MLRDFPRALRLLQRVLDGATFAVAGDEIGVQGERARQLVYSAARNLRVRAYHRKDAVPAPDDGALTSLLTHADWYRRQIHIALGSDNGEASR